MDGTKSPRDSLALWRCTRLTVAILVEAGLLMVLLEPVALVGSAAVLLPILGPDCGGPEGGICEPGLLFFLAMMVAIPAMMAAGALVYFGLSAWRGRSPVMVLVRVPARAKRPQGLLAYLAGEDHGPVT